MSATTAPEAPRAEIPPIGWRESLGHILRALRYAWPVRHLFLRKLVYGLIGIIPYILLPWPAKMVVDHVVLKQPLDASQYPGFFQPIVHMLDGASPERIVLFFLLMLLGTLVIFGGWGADSSQDKTGANLGNGHDIASRSENVANQAGSEMGGILGWLDFQAGLRISHALNHHYRSRLFERIQHLPASRLTDQRIGDAMYRLMYDTPEITEVCKHLVLTPVLTPAAVIVTLIVMSQTYSDAPEVLITAALMVPVAFLFTLPFSGRMRRYAQQARGTGAETTVTIEEGMSNILAVQGLGGQARERERFDRDSWRSYDEARSYMVIWVIMGLGLILLAILIGVTLFVSVTDRVFEGTMTVGDVSVVMVFFGQFAGHASKLGQTWIRLQDNVVGLKRVFELIDEPVDHQDEDALPLPTIRQGFRFEGVGFQYDEGTRALESVDLEARMASMVAVVGPAGAGKTTLVQMVPRFLRPTEGRITVDGLPLDRVDREDLRQQIAFVFQEPVLFDATIAENLRVSKPEASEEELWKAARAAGAAEFIERMPEGMATPLGRGGGRLSVGQKQRLSIARALLRDAPVLILDEPTAALDPETEARLVETLRAESRKRLVLVIAHRLSTIRDADTILFLEQGRVVEQGNHASLMAREDGAYRRFTLLQRSG